jgi:hypothetical protein
MTEERGGAENAVDGEFLEMCSGGRLLAEGGKADEEKGDG